ncbi:unnamed protein product [Urochloa humidicola]
METFGGATFAEGQAKRSLPAVAWSCSMATVLALATVAPVAAAGNGDEATSRVGNNVAAANLGGGTTTVQRERRVDLPVDVVYPCACKTALTSSEVRSGRGDPFAASVQFAPRPGPQRHAPWRATSPPRGALPPAAALQTLQLLQSA